MFEWSTRNDDLSAELHDLLQASLSGTADEADQARLEQLIVDDPEARALYVLYLEEAAGLQMLATAEGGIAESMLPDQDSLGEVRPDLHEFDRPSTPAPETSTGVSEVSTADRPWGFRSRRRLRTAVILVAVVAVAAGIALSIPLNVGTTSPESGSQRVAQLRQAVGVSWHRDGKPISSVSGQWLMNGRYRLNEGIAQVAFPWGAEATFEGPAEFDLQPNEDRTLLYGQMIAKVPPNDTGFTVQTPAVEVIDLGTEFGLLVARDGDSEVHVFKGEVEARGLHGGQALNGPLRLTAGQATRFDHKASANVEAMSVAYNPNRFSRAWQTANRVEATSGAVRFVHPPPANIVPGNYESSSQILIFLERQDIVLPTATAVTLSQPGLYTTFSDRCEWLPADLKVDSYLVHFDPVGDSRTRPAVSVEGSVTFANPVVAVITRGDQLAAVDKVCASPTTDYFGINLRGQGRYYSVAIRGMVGCWRREHMLTEPLANDRIRLSPDRRTLTVQLSAGNETDQIRVLVASSLEESTVSWGSLSINPPQPFLGKPFTVGETIQAEHFDEGGDGIAYYDSTPSALSSHYRLDSSVEMLPLEYPDELDYCLALFRNGEWVGYTVEIAEPGNYVLFVRAASGQGGGSVHFEFGEQYATNPIVVPNTGTALTFQWIKSAPLELTPGRYFMRLVMDKPNVRGNWVANFDCFRIERADADLPEDDVALISDAPTKDHASGDPSAATAGPTSRD